MTTMTLNTNLNGIELYFDEKPADAIREAMKNLGFRWSPKKAMWWAKQTPERLALANSLVEESPKTKAKKSAKKAEPKVEFSELGEKTTYTVVGAKGFETRKGYMFTAKVGKTTLQLGVAKEKDGTWTLTELTTGIAVGADYEKRFMAHKALEVKEVKSIAKMLKEEEYQKRAKALEKHNKKASK